MIDKEWTNYFKSSNLNIIPKFKYINLQNIPYNESDLNIMNFCWGFAFEILMENLNINVENTGNSNICQNIESIIKSVPYIFR